MGAGRSDLVSLIESAFNDEVDIAHVARSLHNKAYPLSYGSAKLRELLAQYIPNLDPTYALLYQDSQRSIPVDTISRYSDKQRPQLQHRHRLGKLPDPFSQGTASQHARLLLGSEDIPPCWSDWRRGLSLCEWMIDHGARHFALASRNPKIGAASMRHLQKKWGNLRDFSLDITNKARLREAYAEIAASTPPTGGVYNGAMTLCDSPLNKTQARFGGFRDGLGMLLGIGLMNNVHGAVDEHMRNMDYMAISEPESHVICVEALLGG
ncbi:hypothetical protein DL770_004514 [Monosporascus sp. CRB-9-2]|nr:hypothetical protein DL770_004514 [Monosporascus sp. CRB-9-2]